MTGLTDFFNNNYKSTFNSLSTSSRHGGWGNAYETVRVKLKGSLRK